MKVMKVMKRIWSYIGNLVAKFMWIQRHGMTASDAFNHIKKDIAAQYPV